MKKMLMLSVVTGSLLLTGCGDTTYDDFNDTEIDQFDEDSPVITLIGERNIQITLGQRTINEPGYTATDAQDGDITYAVKVTNDIDLNHAGTYTVTYNVMDSEGNTDIETRTITIIDPNSNQNNNNNDNSTVIHDDDTNYGGGLYPEIKFPGGNPLYLALGEEYDTRYSATDPEDGDLGDRIKIEGDNFDVNTEGTYTVNYSVTDSDGNTAYAQRQVFVGNYGKDSDSTWNDTTTTQLEDFENWYSDSCGQIFNKGYYNENTGYYSGTISCSGQGLQDIDLNTLSIFSSIKSLDLSNNSLSSIDLTPLENVNIINELKLNNNNLSYIDYSPLHNVYINDLWVNGNNLNYTESERKEIFRGFKNVDRGSDYISLYIHF